jgi:hypothetical protein
MSEGPLARIIPPGWGLARATGLLAGFFTLFSLLMGRLHHRRWRLMTALIGANLILQAFTGACPASLLLRRLGVPETPDAE